MKPKALPGDVLRILDDAELPSTTREIPPERNPLANGVLMAHQVAWLKACQKYDLLLSEKGRRTGITFATALNDTINAASTREAGGDDVYYIGDTKEKGLEFIGYCAALAKVMASAMADGWQGIEVFLFADQQPDGSTKEITSYRIRFASGFKIVALSSNPASIRGLQGVVVIDEAAYHRDVQAVIDAATALIIWGGKIRIISTHNGDKNPFNQLIKDSRSGRYDFHIERVTFDDAVANGLYERVCLVKGWKPTAEGKAQWYQRVRGAYGANKAAMKEELDAIPREGSGVAIPGILIEQAMREERPVLRLAFDNEFAARDGDYRKSWVAAWIKQELDPLLDTLDQKLVHVLGEDFARHMDLTVLAPLAIEQNLTRKAPFIVELANVPTRQQEQILWHLISRLPRFGGAAMDATGPGQTLAEYTADKFGHAVIEQVMLNNAWYRENMGIFQSAFEDQVIDLPRDADIANDLRALERIDGIIKLPKLRTASTSGDQKRHGDCAIALALGYYKSLNTAAPIDFQSSGDNMSSDFDAYTGVGVGAHIKHDTGFGSIAGGTDFGGFV